MSKIVTSKTGVTKTGGVTVPTSNLNKTNSTHNGKVRSAVGGASVKVSAVKPNQHQQSATKAVDGFGKTNMHPL